MGLTFKFTFGDDSAVASSMILDDPVILAIGVVTVTTAVILLLAVSSRNDYYRNIHQQGIPSLFFHQDGSFRFSLLSSSSSSNPAAPGATILLTRTHLEPIMQQKWKQVMNWIDETSSPNQQQHQVVVGQLQDVRHQTVLHHMCLFQAPSYVIEKIVHTAPELAKIPNIDGELALHWATRLSTPNRIFKVLVRANPISGFWKDKDGVTPISLLWGGHQERIIQTWREGSYNQLFQLNSWIRILFLIEMAYHHSMQQQQQQQQKQSTMTTTVDETIFGATTSTTTTTQQDTTTTTIDDYYYYHDEEEEGEEDNDDDENTMMISRRHFPLHAATSQQCPPGLFPFMIQVYKDQLLQRDSYGYTPLDIATFSPMVNANTSSCFDAADDDGGGRLTTTATTTTNTTKIQLLLREVPSETATAQMKDTTLGGRYPLHRAIASGIQWEDGVNTLFGAYPSALTIRDPSTHLYPFLLAATTTEDEDDSIVVDDDNYGLSTTYTILRTDPSLLHTRT